LLYHDVLPAGSPQPPDKGNIAVDRLCEHVQALRARGFQFIDLATAFTLLERDAPPREPPKCVLTFDDAMQGLYDCWPELAPMLDATVSVFVITASVGQPNLWNARTPVIAQHMSLPNLLELGERGVDLELHGTDHHNMVKFAEAELEARFARGISWFEGELGRAPRYLAYPYGAFNSTVESTVKRYFDGALSVNHGHWWGPPARWGLNRISVPFYLSGSDLVEIVCSPPAERWFETEKRAPWWQETKR
jgi:peptidoglycan/xylan/chitin deacetylase (PgdA/CDA1 family)